MNEFDEKWIKDIRSRLDNHPEPLPVDLWEKIDSEISAPKVIPMWKRWYSVAAAAAAIVVVSTLSLVFWENSVSNESVRMANEILPSVNDVTILPVNDSHVLSSSDNIESESVFKTNVSKKVLISAAVARKEVRATEKPVSPVTVEDGDDYEIVEDVNMDERNGSSRETDVSRKRIDMMKADREVQKRNASYLAMTHNKNGKSGIGNVQVGLLTGNTPYSSSSSFSGISRLSSRKLMSQTNDIVISESADGAVTYSQVLFNNMDKETYTKVKHHMPVSVGASVKWNFSDDWGLETGLSYTYLYSELQSGANSYVEDKQKLHYVGIPIKLHRSIWGNKLFSFYASAGGMVEKCVSGSMETVCVDNYRGKSTERESIGVKPWQLSAMASLGAQMNILRIMSLYVEPGMAYYFDDNSELLTIRKEHPFNFNLQFGLRFNVGK